MSLENERRPFAGKMSGGEFYFSFSSETIREQRKTFDDPDVFS
jgi:hypothetical protein